MTPKRRSFLSALFFTCFKLILNKKDEVLRLTWKIMLWLNIFLSLNRGPDPELPLHFHHSPASRSSVISVPKTFYFPNTASRAKIMANPAYRVAVKSRPVRKFCVFPHPVKLSRIPHYNSVKSRIPRMPFHILSCWVSLLFFPEKYSHSIHCIHEKKKNQQKNKKQKTNNKHLVKG